MMDFLDAADHYVRLGLKVIPIKPGSKAPATAHGFKDATDDMEQIKLWARQWPNANIAARCGPETKGNGLTVVDVDKHHGGIESMKQLLARNGAMQPCPMSTTPRGGYHLFFRYQEGITNSNNALGDGIDVKTARSYIMLPPSEWEGMSYRWVRKMRGIQLPPMPTWMRKRLLPKPMPKFAPKQWDRSNANLVQVAKALKSISNHDYGTWTMVGMALKAEFGDEAFDLWCSWSGTGYSKFDPKECRQKWRSFKRSDGVRIGSVFHAARMAGADLKKILKHGGLAA